MNKKDNSNKKNIKHILNKLEENGYKAYLVGGYLRDKLLKIESFDYDIATNAKPKEILEVFANYKTIRLGEKFGTIKILYKDCEFEITTFRKESSYKDKRHPEDVFFADTIKEDLQRRDFTINAIAYRNGEYIDPFLGREDLEKKILKACGNPYQRIKEDALRSLRAVRFCAKLGFKMDEDLEKAIKANSKDIKKLSKERIQDEINKILMTKRNVYAIRLMDRLDILPHIFPEISNMKGFNQHSTYHNLDLFEHTLSVLANVDGDLETRLAALFHDSGKISTMFIDKNGEGRFFSHQNESEKIIRKRMQDLKYSKKMIEETALLVKRHMDNTNTYTKKSIRKLYRNLGEENLLRLFDLQKADKLSTKDKDLSNIERGKELLEEVLKEDFPKSKKEINIDGYDLIKLGFKPSKKIGIILKDVEELIYDEKLSNTKEEIIKYIENKYITIDWNEDKSILK